MPSDFFGKKPIDLLSSLVAIESVNPVYGGSGEGRISSYVREWLFSRGIPYQIQNVEPGRENIVARIGNGDGGAVLIEAHMDTVGTGGWFSGSPNELRKEGSRFYGRGACDTKASLACFMLTIAHFHEHPSELRCPIVFAASVDEESEQKGAYELAKLKSELGIEFAITGEPTQSIVVSRHKGVCRYDISTSGKAAHGSTPELGDNAIYKMSRICSELEKYAIEIGETNCVSPIERGSINLGTIVGGIGFNVVPDTCKIEVDRRLGIHESLESAAEDLRRIVSKIPGAELNRFLERPPLVGSISKEFVESILESAELAGERSHSTDVAYMTNAVAYESVNIPSIVFGPGDIAQAHKIDEYIEEGEMERSLAILKRFFRR